MYFSKRDIANTPKIRRLNMVNSISGIKPGNLIGTRSNDGCANLTVISSVVHVGSNPALLGFIMRPHENTRRDTFNNIQENGAFTINHIREGFIEQAHYTSAKFEETVSEFDRCGLTEESLFDFHAPFVEESVLKMGLCCKEIIPIPCNNTLMIIGEVEHLIIPDGALEKEGYVNLDLAGSVGISGLNTYCSIKNISSFPYARVSETPSFKR